MQELILAASHAYTVEAGELASRIPLLQTRHGPTPDGLVPTRLCSLAEVRAGLPPEQDDIVTAASACCNPTCPDGGTPFGDDGPGARVIASGCLHSYCKQCISSLITSDTSAHRTQDEQVFCLHPACNARLQLGMLRQVACEAAVDAAELALDPTPSWRGLDKCPPAPAGTPGSPLTELRVMACDSQLNKVGEGGSVATPHGQYVTAASCIDGHDEVRPLGAALVVCQPAVEWLPRLLRPANRAGECPICIGPVSERDATRLPCYCTEVYHEECLRRDIRSRHNDFACPTCRNTFAGHEDATTSRLYFCNASCGYAAFNRRLVKIGDAQPGRSPRHVSDTLADRACDAPDCDAPLNASQLTYRCEWAGQAALGSYRFCSKLCASSWFRRRLQQSTQSFDWSSFQGNRQLYAPGQASRELTQLTPLYRQADSNTWYKLGVESAFRSERRPVNEWNEMVMRFPGMPYFSFLAHLDAAAGHWSHRSAVPLGPKLTKLMALIDEQEDDDKVLVFSQSARMLELTAVRLDGEYGAGFCRYGKEGAEALAAFRDDPRCCVLLLESGAFAAGLTLTVANTCIVLEPQLDRAVEAQLESRIWRPGQQRDVRIVHLYMRGTVEERLVQHSRPAEEADEWDGGEGAGEGAGAVVVEGQSEGEGEDEDEMGVGDSD